MNKIKAMLHESLSENAMKFLCIEEQLNDIRWLIEKGYASDFWHDKRGFMRGGELNAKGKVFVEKYGNEMFDYYNKDNDKTLNDNNITQLQKRLRKYIKSNPDIDIDEGLSETESYAFRNVYYNKW